MTIEKGKPWGEDGVLADDGIVVATDAEGSRVIAEAREAGHTPPMLGLVGGDLCRTLGGPGDRARLRGSEARRYPVDLGVAVVDGATHYFVAHLIAHHALWRGRAIAAMNAQWYGEWDLGPRSHPNDGLLDVSDGRMSWADRFAARRRLSTGTHLPHPLITVKRTAAIELELERPTPVYLDGVRIGTGQHLSLRVEPDALIVVV